MIRFLIGLFTTFAGVGTIETDVSLGFAVSLVGVLLMFSGAKALQDMEYDNECI